MENWRGLLCCLPPQCPHVFDMLKNLTALTNHLVGWKLCSGGSDLHSIQPLYWWRFTDPDTDATGRARDLLTTIPHIEQNIISRWIALQFVIQWVLHYEVPTG